MPFKGPILQASTCCLDVEQEQLVAVECKGAVSIAVSAAHSWNNIRRRLIITQEIDAHLLYQVTERLITSLLCFVIRKGVMKHATCFIDSRRP